MKKSIFLSVLALAAVVSCQKSEIVDTKYGNDAIGFETYTGRDAQTKATLLYGATKHLEAIGVYGFYLGTADGWTKSSVANLWVNESFAPNTDGIWATTNKKYWTNGTDKYTFFAYAPYATAGTLALGSGTGAGSLVAPVVTETLTQIVDPKLTYTVPTVLANQIDLIYSNNLNPTWKDQNNTKLEFQHALSRISVWAKDNHDDFSYTITAISLKGNFIGSNNLNLATGNWDSASTSEITYPFVVNAGSVATEAAASVTTDDYLMIIPVLVTDAVLSVTYNTTYEGIPSASITKEVKLSQNFAKGKAYAIKLEFAPNENDEIKFNVSVTEWVDDTVDETTGNKKNPETDVTTDPKNVEEGDL